MSVRYGGHSVAVAAVSGLRWKLKSRRQTSILDLIRSAKFGPDYPGHLIYTGNHGAGAGVAVERGGTLGVNM